MSSAEVDDERSAGFKPRRLVPNGKHSEPAAEDVWG
jgi:hypothetical protein